MKAQVLLPKIFNFSFTYNSNNIPLKIGDLVEVPFGKSREIGVIWKNKNTELKKHLRVGMSVFVTIDTKYEKAIPYIIRPFSYFIKLF